MKNGIFFYIRLASKVSTFFILNKFFFFEKNVFNVLRVKLDPNALALLRIGQGKQFFHYYTNLIMFFGS